jgi:hypothetical protein
MRSREFPARSPVTRVVLPVTRAVASGRNGVGDETVWSALQGGAGGDWPCAAFLPPGTWKQISQAALAQSAPACRSARSQSVWQETPGWDMTAALAGKRTACTTAAGRPGCVTRTKVVRDRERAGSTCPHASAAAEAAWRKVLLGSLWAMRDRRGMRRRNAASTCHRPIIPVHGSHGEYEREKVETSTSAHRMTSAIPSRQRPAAAAPRHGGSRLPTHLAQRLLIPSLGLARFNYPPSPPGLPLQR